MTDPATALAIVCVLGVVVVGGIVTLAVMLGGIRRRALEESLPEPADPDDWFAAAPSEPNR